MADEIVLPDTASDTPEVGADEVSGATPGSTENAEAPENEGLLAEAPQDDDVEVDIDGEKYKIPQKLKDAFMRTSDYSKKTAEVAEQRRAFEAERQSFQKNMQLQQQSFQDSAQLYALDEQIKQFKNLDWEALIDQDPVQAMKLQHQQQSLLQMRNQTASNMYQAQQAMALEQQHNYAKQLEVGREQLTREIKGWSPEMASNLAGYGTESGFTKDEIGSIVDPRQVKILHKAYLYDQLMKKATPTPAKVEVKPIQKVASNSGSATKNPDNMSTEEWLKWRASDLRKKK